jgi:hypothetical protein
MKLLIAVLLFSLLIACDTATRNPSSGATIKDTAWIGRFVVIPEAANGEPVLPRGSFALDTVTGNLCRTWDFSWPNPSAAQRNIQALPLCRQFYINSTQ